MNMNDRRSNYFSLSSSRPQRRFTPFFIELLRLYCLNYDFSISYQRQNMDTIIIKITPI